MVDDAGNLIGDHNKIPYLNTVVYEVEFDDGRVREYGANIIAGNLYDQVNSEGYRYQHTISVLGHRTTEKSS